MAQFLITGGSGQLGSELKLILGNSSVAIGKDLMDVGDSSSTEAIIRIKPEIVFHCAAYTNVDKCESFPEKAYQTNVIGTKHVALACKKIEIPLVYVSTDYIFDGKASSPYCETDSPSPINIYGETKLEGERVTREILRSKHYIVRTGWLYGFGERNFVRSILTKVAQNASIEMVTNQTGNPTSAHDLAHAIARLVETGTYGTYHLAAKGHSTRYEFAEEILKYIGRTNIDLIPIEHYPQAAKRPSNTRLENVRAKRLGIELLPWEAALKAFLYRLKLADMSVPEGFVWH